MWIEFKGGIFKVNGIFKPYVSPKHGWCVEHLSQGSTLIKGFKSEQEAQDYYENISLKISYKQNDETNLDDVVSAIGDVFDIIAES